MDIKVNENKSLLLEVVSYSALGLLVIIANLGNID
jgi:hypothetical protein